MFTTKRIATLAVITAAAIIPAFGAQAANASTGPERDLLARPCVVKWILPPPQVDMGEEGSTFDNVDHQASGTEHTDDPFDTIQQDGSGGLYDTVEHDDFSYSGC